MLHHNIRPRATPIAVPALISAIDVLAPDVRRLVLQLPPAHAFRYRAGQYVSLVLPDGSRRSLSPACAPRTGGTIEFHLQRRPNGVLTGLVFDDYQPGDSITLEGPFGHCVLGYPAAPALMLATGTGIAPLLAMLEENFAARAPREIALFWGGRSAADLYAAPRLEEWAREHDHFRFFPVLSPNGAYVQDAAAAIFPDLFGVDIYACGSPRMVEAARQKLLALPGAAADRFHADAFEPADAALSAAGPPIGIKLLGATAIPIQVPLGGSLLTGLTAAGVPVDSVCGGQASCGTCRVKLTPEWHGKLPPPNRTERRLLACLQEPHPNHRLACQIALDATHAGLEFALDPERGI